MTSFLDPVAREACLAYFASRDSAAIGRRAFDADLQQTFAGDWHVRFPAPLFRQDFLSDVGDAARRMLELLYSLPRRVFEGDAARMLRYQGVPESTAEYLLSFLREPLLARARLYARPDMIVTANGVKFVEANVSPSLGGMGVCDRYLRAFMASDLARDLRERGVEFSQPATDDIWRRVFLRACQSPPGDARPVLLKLLPEAGQDPDALFYAPDYVSMVDRAGYDVLTAKPDGVRIARDGVYVGDRRVDVVFSDFMFCEQEAYDVPRALVDGFVELEGRGRVHLLSAPAACALYDNKANFAMLTDPAFGALFTAQERAFIDAHVPYTRVLDAAAIDWAIEHRESLVLKPSLGLEGRDIHFGEGVPAGRWHALLETALASKRPFVVQELVRDIWTYLPVDDPAGAPRMVCLGAFVFDGEPAGVLIRDITHPDSRTRVVNVAQGASWSTAVGVVTSASPTIA